MKKKTVYVETSIVSYLTMSDVIIEELWKIKDSIAEEHGYSIDSLVAHLKAQEVLSGLKAVTPRAKKSVARSRKPGKSAHGDIQ